MATMIMMVMTIKKSFVCLCEGDIVMMTTTMILMATTTMTMMTAKTRMTIIMMVMTIKKVIVCEYIYLEESPPLPET